MKKRVWMPILLTAVAFVLLSLAMARADDDNLKLGVICQDATVGQDNSFNINVQCPAGQVVVTGGYQCTDGGELLDSNVQENTFAFTTVGKNNVPTPTGWQTIGHLATPYEGVAATCRVCISCSPGSCQDTGKNSVCLPKTKP